MRTTNRSSRATAEADGRADVARGFRVRPGNTSSLAQRQECGAAALSHRRTRSRWRDGLSWRPYTLACKDIEKGKANALGLSDLFKIFRACLIFLPARPFGARARQRRLSIAAKTAWDPPSALLTPPLPLPLPLPLPPPSLAPSPSSR